MLCGQLQTDQIKSYHKFVNILFIDVIASHFNGVAISKNIHKFADRRYNARKRYNVPQGIIIRRRRHNLP